MDLTPKLHRKSSMSLSARLNKKRHSASPQNILKSSTTNGGLNSREQNYDALQRSPSVISICSDGGIECTPPHKKIALNLDESIEFSPKIFDNSFSPTCLLSQTLAIDSPEVGWKWNRHSANHSNGLYVIENSAVGTPDSAYAADSSFASAGSSSTEVGNDRAQGYFHKQRDAIGARRENQRKILEQEIRRAEKTRADEKLKQRCAKLQEQLKSAGTQNFQIAFNENVKESKVIPNSSSSNGVEMNSKSTICASINATVNIESPENLKNSELFNDFFNDSDVDSFLLEATQEIESKIGVQTQSAAINISNTIPKTAPATISSSPSNKEKRSSFYMKFLEDDCPDDWFISLDVAISEALKNKKPHTSLQRYKSMPSETATSSNVILNKKSTNGNCTMNSKTNSSKYDMLLSDEMAVSSSTLSKIKRRSSTHTLSPSSTNSRSRRQL